MVVKVEVLQVVMDCYMNFQNLIQMFSPKIAYDSLSNGCCIDLPVRLACRLKWSSVVYGKNEDALLKQVLYIYPGVWTGVSTGM